MLDSTCFLYASFLRISNVETVFFSVLKYKSYLPYVGVNKNFKNFMKRIIQLDIFVIFRKKEHFLYFKTSIILSIFILQF